MRKIILTYGVISGLVVIGSMIFGIVIGLDENAESGTNLEYIGYLIMLVALSIIFVGIKRYRDQELGGVITFGTAFLVGIGITAVAGAMYVAVWEIYLAMTDYAFMDQYIAAMIATEEAKGISAAEMDALVADLEQQRRIYGNLLFRLGITFMEIFPVGLVIALISAAILRKSEVFPANA